MAAGGTSIFHVGISSLANVPTYGNAANFGEAFSGIIPENLAKWLNVKMPMNRANGALIFISKDGPRVFRHMCKNTFA